MKRINYLLILLLLITSCRPNSGNRPEVENVLSMYDSVYVVADIQYHQHYYPNLDCEVYSIDLLSDGLSFDSAYQIVGSGMNLYISDVFLPDSCTTLQEGVYQMDTTAQPYTFLPYMHFEGSVTGCYMLDIRESQMNRIIGFSDGRMEIRWLDNDDIQMDILLYLPDSSRYHASYQGPALPR